MVAISDTDKSGGPLLRMGKLTTYALYIVPAHPGELSSAEMGDCNHLVLAKFKEGVVVEDLLKGMEKLASEMDTVKSFQWGHDTGSDEMLRQGFTHVILLTFRNAEDFSAFLGHPSHIEFSGTFAAAIEKILVFDYPTVVVKSPA
ncbi:stress-response A/B barrel domain-containing protein At5g22580-like isoform X1 [Magnolia sinica]|uniref:stress-response A/B barrel domain-containing protein At5g22580-like isoform X1 n=1 Tax=Magnolia sinica TaxID=86752 RepID=UPI002658EC96|nr:stress-response A/B barrel domain-containing protein At5g22580-like isoform X1 [Magnolia sinica]